ncbi:DUF2490 domain-containing protein [Mariniflexile jejuense]|uniref:DUF2490 domain-containing protein n=1 Tax=Mariniflexile jejuense TaxID=1173582 RepID=A0ABW3JLH3_9FLAO
MFRYKLISLLLVFFAIAKVHAQKNIENQQLLWLRYNLKLKLNDSYQITQEFDERNFVSPWRQHQFLARTRLERIFNTRWKAAVGFTVIEQSLPTNPEVKNYYNITELTPQFEVYNKQTLSNKLALEHRYWTDFRFFEQPDGSFEFNNLRARYRLELQYNVIQNVTLKAFDEVFINAGGKIVNNVFDQNRVGGSIQYMPTKIMGLELGYFNAFQQRPSGVDFYNRNVVRFTIHHNVNLKKLKNHA